MFLLTKKMAVSTGLALAMSFTSPAFAGCSWGDGGGYVYVRASCTQERRVNPQNICQIKKDYSVKTKNVAFYSSVIYDNAKNDRYPASQFFDEMKIQHDITKNGAVSSCFSSRGKAEDARRKSAADDKRLGFILKDVYMRDS